MASRPLPTEPDTSESGVITPTAFRPPGTLRGLQWPAMPWVPLALIATVVLTALVMGYLLLARSVSIESMPADAELDVDGWFTPRIGSHWLLTPGTHAVYARAAGYKPLSTWITVTADTLQAQRVALTPLPGKLTIGAITVRGYNKLLIKNVSICAPGHEDRPLVTVPRIIVLLDYAKTGYLDQIIANGIGGHLDRINYDLLDAIIQEVSKTPPVSYTHLTLPTNREV